MTTRFVDSVVAALGLALCAPLIAVAGWLIRRASPGPVFHRAERAGREGAPFTMYKLRTMHAGGPSSARITGSADPRVFPVGRVLRRLKIDELPQLAHVLRGDMSLVGPRPEDVSIVSEHYDVMMKESLTVRPGMTSPGSLHYLALEKDLPHDPDQAEIFYLDRLLPEKIALDLVYVRQPTARYYLEILLRTALGVAGLRPPSLQRREAKERDQARAILVAGGHRG